MKKILLYIGITAIVAGCATDESSNEVLSDSAATFTAGVASRVSGTNWESTDEVGILVLDSVSGEVSSDYPFNAHHTVSTDGAFTPYDLANTIYYSVDPADCVNFYAYYPYSSAIDEDALSYRVNVAQQSVPTNIDFMEAIIDDDCNKKSGTVVMTFNRRLTKFTIQLSATDGFTLSDVTAVRFEGFYTTANYSFESKSYSSLGNIADITPLKSGNSYSAILIPMNSGEYTLGDDHKVVFETTMGDVVWELKDSKNDTAESAISLKAGSEHTFNVTISREDFDAKAVIKEWTEVDNNITFNTDNN